MQETQYLVVNSGHNFVLIKDETNIEQVNNFK